MNDVTNSPMFIIILSKQAHRHSKSLDDRDAH